MKNVQLVCYKLHLNIQFNCIKKIFHLRVLKNYVSAQIWKLHLKRRSVLTLYNYLTHCLTLNDTKYAQNVIMFDFPNIQKLFSRLSLIYRCCYCRRDLLSRVKCKFTNITYIVGL